LNYFSGSWGLMSTPVEPTWNRSTYYDLTWESDSIISTIVTPDERSVVIRRAYGMGDIVVTFSKYNFPPQNSRLGPF
jgi:hypothetical protein